MKTQRPLAIFDIDGTVFRSSLILELCFALVDAGIFPKRVRREVKASQLAWFDRKAGYEDYIMAVVKTYRRTIPGKRQRDVRRVANQVVRKLKDRVYRYTRDLIRSLRGRYHLLAISGSPQEIVDAFNRFWKFSAAFGALYEVDRYGIYTGRVLRSLAEDKQPFLKAYLHENGFTLKGSVGVGDTEADASFLRFVDRPIAFNPNAQLLATARRRGWKVVVERKDAIYTV